MGTKTFTEFQSELTYELGERDDVSTRVDDWVNTAYMVLATKNRLWNLKKDIWFPELETTSTDSTADGTNYVSVPSDAIIVRTIEDTSTDAKLIHWGWREHAEATGKGTEASRSKPKNWVRLGSRLYLNPTPDAAYGLRIGYRKRPAALSATTDVTAIGAEWDEPILLRAAILGHRKLKEYDQAKLKKEELDEMIRDIVGIYDKEEFDSDAFFQRDYGYYNITQGY